MSKALGLVEVRGYVAAVEAADSALKAANVTLIGLEKIKGGITTIKITGDVGAVKAAVDAAKASVEKLGTFRTAHVIPRVDSQVQELFFEKKPEVKEEISKSLSSKNEKEVIKDFDEKTKSPVQETKTKEETIVENKPEPKANKINVEGSKNEIDYNAMKVEELRRLVRSLQIPNMTNKQIKFAKKDVLVKTILEYNKAGEK
ncbi:MAG: BMC domain-containing protein [Clostridium sp.]|uniref:BMC domain-containing protein n=1 Tax=Clostridium sp. TaxID=1506 RepID=UPI00303EE02C